MLSNVSADPVLTGSAFFYDWLVPINVFRSPESCPEVSLNWKIWNWFRELVALGEVVGFDCQADEGVDFKDAAC